MRDEAHKTLFGISPFKCLDFEQCTCKPKNRVAVAESNFFSDQRSAMRGNCWILQQEQRQPKNEIKREWQELSNIIINLHTVLYFHLLATVIGIKRRF